VASVTIPGTEGEMGIYPGHSPVLTTLRPGVVTVTRDGGAAERIFVKGGMAEVNPQGLTLLAEVAVPMAELTAEVMAKQVSAAEADLADAKPGEAQRKATEVLNQLKALQSTL
jgi:F-type H+-transporting ATPase subunit epsilon